MRNDVRFDFGHTGDNWTGVGNRDNVDDFLIFTLDIGYGPDGLPQPCDLLSLGVDFLNTFSFDGGGSVEAILPFEWLAGSCNPASGRRTGTRTSPRPPQIPRWSRASTCPGRARPAPAPPGPPGPRGTDGGAAQSSRPALRNPCDAHRGSSRAPVQASLERALTAPGRPGYSVYALKWEPSP